MLNQWLCVLFQASPGLAQGFAMDSMQTAKKNAPPKWVRVGFWVIVSIVSTLYNIFGKPSSASFNYVSCLAFVAAVVVSVRYFYHTSFLRQLSITLILLMVIGSAELVIMPMMWLLRIPSVSLDYSHPDMVLTVLIGVLFQIFFCFS